MFAAPLEEGSKEGGGAEAAATKHPRTGDQEGAAFRVLVSSSVTAGVGRAAPKPAFTRMPLPCT